MDIKKWLEEPCEEIYIRYLDPQKTIAYLPIGIIEQYLDNFRSWGASNFHFTIHKASNHWFASGSVSLEVEYEHDGKDIKRSLPGGMTMTIGSTDENTDYEATILSYCISNAAKKLGRRFGRHLNGRLDIGETGLPVIQLKEPLEQDDKIKMEYMEVEKKLKSFKYQQPAQEYLETTSFKMYIPAKQIVNSKPVKK